MKLIDISDKLNEWFDGRGPLSDIVISSRVRLARNLAGYKFLSRCSSEEKAEILEKLKSCVMSLNIGDKTFYVDIEGSSTLDKHFLIERHLISRNHAFGKGPRGAVISEHESFSAMINEEDHLRIQFIKGGSQLSSCYEQINNIDDMIEQQGIDYAFSPRYGYLTACPTNIGTGIRVSVMLHLPALKLTEHIEKFFQATRAMNLAVRGLFGEGTQASGDFYQVSNQVTLGVTELEVIKLFEKSIIPEIVDYEKAARQELLSKESDVLDDKISRSMALLKNAQLISSQEALFLLSHLRLGLSMRETMGASSEVMDQLGSICGSDGALSVATINRLFMLTLPAHLQLNYGKELDAAGRDAQRAKIIRQSLVQG